MKAATLLTTLCGALCYSTVAVSSPTTPVAGGINILLSNDDGWAEANIRAFYQRLTAAGHNVVLSAPAENESGTGSMDAPPTPLTSPGEFNSIPAGSPAVGFNASNDRLNYVNSYPVTSVKYGVKTLGPKFFPSGVPDLIVTGPNVGTNLGAVSQFSGTVGAANEGAILGIPSIAFSGTTGSQVSYTTLTKGDYSYVYADLSVKVVEALIAGGKPFLPNGTALTVNYPAVDSNCSDASKFTFSLTRIYSNPLTSDYPICGSSHLPTESNTISQTNCRSTVSAFQVPMKNDSGKAVQQVVAQKLKSILTCP